MRVLRSSVFLAALALSPLVLSQPASAGLFVSVQIAPPALPVYAQPPLPAPGYIWTPGYWAYGDAGYYWVPGTWVMAPQPGLLWTPAYWGWSEGVYVFHAGYWGPHVGFYGGINYGFGYGGVGYLGGRWDHGEFAYNRSVNNVNITNVHNVYTQNVVNNTTVNRVSFNGGAGGINARPNAEEQAFEHEQHVPPTALQAQHQQVASTNRAQFASVNHGRPGVAASPRPGAMSGRGVVAATVRPAGVGHAQAGGQPHPAAAPHPQRASRPQQGRPAGHEKEQH